MSESEFAALKFHLGFGINALLQLGFFQFLCVLHVLSGFSPSFSWRPLRALRQPIPNS